MTDTVSSAVTAGESFVQKIITDIQTAVEVVDADFNAAMGWLGNEIENVAPEVAAVVEGVAASVTTLSGLGLPLPADTQTAINDANDAVAGLNAAAAAIKAGSSTPEALVTGYVTVKTALGTANLAAAAIAANPSANPVIPVTT